MIPAKICDVCKKTYIPNSYNQRFCGSNRQKTGCSYLMHYNLRGVYLNKKSKGIRPKREFVFSAKGKYILLVARRGFHFKTLIFREIGRGAAIKVIDL